MTAQVLARSTRLKSRLPGGTEFQDIFGRVHVAVMPRSAIGHVHTRTDSGIFGE